MDISLTEGIKFGKEDLCKDMGSQINDLQGGLNRTVSLGRSYGASSVLTGITNIDESLDFVPTANMDSALGGLQTNLDSKLGGIQSVKDKISSGEIVEGSNISVQSITECLSGVDLSKFGNPDGTIPMSSMGKVLEEATSWLADNMLDMLSELVDPLEKGLADAIDGLRKLLDIPALDKLLGFLECLQDCPGGDFGGMSTNVNQYRIYCVTEQKEYVVYSDTPPGSNACPTDPGHYCDEDLVEVVQVGVPSPVAVEEKLSSIGLTLNGDIDWSSAVFADAPITQTVMDNVTKVTDLKKGIEDQLLAAKEFSPVPEIPELPEIPKIENPINKLDVAQKLEALF